MLPAGCRLVKTFKSQRESIPMILPLPRCLSVVAPLYNEESNVEELYRRLRTVMLAMGQEYELVLVDNGSTDRTLEYLKKLRQQDPAVRYISLSRNYNHQGGLVAGLEHARGDVIISMDGDLQHPPEVIPEMVAQWQLGYQVVFTLKHVDQTQGKFRQWTNRLFYRLMSHISGLNITGGQSDFRLMDRQALNALLALPEYGKFLRGLSQWIGFKQAGIRYQVAERFAGRSKFRFKELFRFALNGIFSFSVLPLRMFTMVGSIIAFLALLQAVKSVVLTWIAILMDGTQVAGYPTLATGIFFLGGVQLIGIGLLGEYLGRIYDEVKRRPIYIVAERSDEL